MNAHSYGWEKLHLAMHSLAGDGTQAKRLVSAIIFNLIHIRPDENLPPRCKESLRSSWTK